MKVDMSAICGKAVFFIFTFRVIVSEQMILYIFLKTGKYT